MHQNVFCSILQFTLQTCDISIKCLFAALRYDIRVYIIFKSTGFE
eukprot:UN01090